VKRRSTKQVDASKQKVRRPRLPSVGGVIDVRFWPKADMSHCTAHVCFRDRYWAKRTCLFALHWTDGRNIRIDTRWTGGEAARTRKYAAELVELEPDIILAEGTTALSSVLQATRRVPIVFVQVTDPVGGGFVASLARPGGNATGFTQFEYSMAGKWLELLKEIAPHVTRAAVLRNPTITSGVGQFGAIQSVAPSLGVELRPIDVRDANEIERGLSKTG
jgi:ABC-type uncharacterized transport system substrate-binding protein